MANSCHTDVDDFVAKSPTSHQSFDDLPTKPSLWNQAHYLRGLAEIHRGYDSISSLNKLQTGIEYVLTKTSKELNLVDVLRNQPVPAWGSTGYSCGKYTTMAVHTGVISYPIAYFSTTVLSNPNRYANYSSSALNYLRQAESAVNVHAGQLKLIDGNWMYVRPNNVSELDHCYKDNGKIDQDYRNSNEKVLPYNMMLALGLTHIELSRAFELPSPEQDLTKSAYHRDRAVKLAQSFKNALTHISSTNSYQWDYAYGSRTEDIAHAGLNIQFIMQMFNEGLIFNNEDIRRLVNTFNIVSSSKNHIFSHLDKTTTNKGTRDKRWQKGIVGWTELALIDPSVREKSREVFYNYDGGYDSSGSNTWYGEALLLKWKDKNTRFPMYGKSHDSLPSLRPDYAVKNANIAGLFRTSAMTAQTIAGKSAASCAEFEFQYPQSKDLSIKYAHTTQTSTIDSCAGESCGEPSGFHVFFAQNKNAPWTFGGSMSHLSANLYHTETVGTSLPEYTRVLACRSGAGHARDNIGIRTLGVDTSMCDSRYVESEFNFTSMDNWVPGDQTDEAAELPKYTYQHQSGNSGRSNGYIEAYEPTDITQKVSASNDPILGNLDLGFHQQFTHFDNGFEVSGWTRSSSRYLGTNKMTNRCVKALNADTNQVLKSHCMHFENTNDTGWRHFNFDFTSYVIGVQNVRIVIGSWDSWGTNWNQHLRVDDVSVKIGRPLYITY